jgi:hypothetical protein
LPGLCDRDLAFACELVRSSYTRHGQSAGDAITDALDLLKKELGIEGSLPGEPLYAFPRLAGSGEAGIENQAD